MEVFTVRWVAVIPPKINIYSLIQCGEGDLRATPMTVWIQSLPTYSPGNSPPMLQGRQAGRQECRGMAPKSRAQEHEQEQRGL